MEKKIAKIFSYILHPLLMPTLGVLVLFQSGSYISYLPYEAKRIILIIVAANTLLIPIALIPVYLYQKVIKNIEINEMRDRLVPLFVTAVFYFAAFYFVNKLPVPRILKIFLLSAAISVFLTTFISFKWKISAHMVGIGGLLGLIFALHTAFNIDLLLYIILGILFTGIAGTSRLVLRAHTPAQVYAGFLLGFGVLFAMSSIFSI